MKTKILALALIALFAVTLSPAYGQSRPVSLTILAADPPVGACSMGRFWINSNTSALFFCNGFGNWSTFAADIDLSGYATQAWVSTNYFPKANSGIMLGSATVNDRISIAPAVKGAAAFVGTITSVDLTAARTWTLPNATGIFALTSDVVAPPFAMPILFLSKSGQQIRFDAASALTSTRQVDFPDATGLVLLGGVTNVMDNYGNTDFAMTDMGVTGHVTASASPSMTSGNAAGNANISASSSAVSLITTLANGDHSNFGVQGTSFGGSAVKGSDNTDSDLTVDFNGANFTNSNAAANRLVTLGVKTDGGVYLTTTGSKPTCNSSLRGSIWRTEGGNGVADKIEMCLKSAADTYAWVALATP
jgi:hypothetical protein